MKKGRVRETSERKGEIGAERIEQKKVEGNKVRKKK